jgi:hypothetical protein
MTESLLEQLPLLDDQPPVSAFGQFFARHATPVDLCADNLLIMSDPGEVVLVEYGSIDLFAARITDGRPVGRWTPLCRLGAGAVLALGSPPGPTNVVIGRPVPGSAVSRVALSDIAALTQRRPRHAGPDDASPTSDDELERLQAGGEFVRGVDLALTALDRALRHALPPREFTALESCESTVLSPRQVVRSVAGVQWVDVLEGTVTAGDAGSAASYAAGDRLCLTELDFLTAGAATRLRVRPTGVLLAAGELLAALVRHAFRFAYALDRAVERRVHREGEALLAQQEQSTRTGRRTQRSFDSLLAQSSHQQAQAARTHESRARRVLATVALRQGIALSSNDSRPRPQPTGGDRGGHQ